MRSLNYIFDYYSNLVQDAAILYSRLKKNLYPRIEEHSRLFKKLKVKQLPYLSLAKTNWKKVVETDASNIGYGGILK